MRREHEAELSDRLAEERSEGEGMPEHPSKAQDPVRWDAERSTRVSPSSPARHVGHGALLGLALLSFGMLAVLSSARGIIRSMKYGRRR
jgi:hypothetical protein